MTAENNVCYYGHRIGCPDANDPNCRRCAERLTHAVNYVALNANSKSAEVAAYVGIEIVERLSSGGSSVYISLA